MMRCRSASMGLAVALVPLSLLFGCTTTATAEELAAGPGGRIDHPPALADLEVANRVAAWLHDRAEPIGAGLDWPVDVDAERPRYATNLYSGTPGVILFLLEHHYATGAVGSLRTARLAAHRLREKVELELGKPRPMGLYTGLAGVAFTFAELYRTTSDPADRAMVERCVKTLQEHATTRAAGCDWGGVTDIISGGAGIGLLLLRLHEQLQDQDALALATRAGAHLLALADSGPEGSGPAGSEAEDAGHRRWAMQPRYPRRMPNFSHGTAGVAYFLARLYQATGEDRFLSAARGGANYLISITRDGLIRHHDGSPELRYLGWCHGPPGTARLFALLYSITAEPAYRRWVENAAARLLATNIPHEKTTGFWHNHGQCCGTAGVADFLLRLHEFTGSPKSDPQLADMVRALRDAGRVETKAALALLSWTGAEHRVRPQQLSTQTGYMQGAAGIGLLFLHRAAWHSGKPRRIEFPDARWR